MRQPTSQQVQTVIDNFEKVLPQATQEGHLNMAEIKVRNENHSCGTVHCHAGWYTVARLDYFEKYDYKGKLTYRFGAKLMHKDLGFEEMRPFAKWTQHFSTIPIWGNPYAYKMFESNKAFYHPEKRPEGAQNLQHIIDHWKEVKERLVLLESKTVTDA